MFPMIMSESKEVNQERVLTINEALLSRTIELYALLDKSQMSMGLQRKILHLWLAYLNRVWEVVKKFLI